MIDSCSASTINLVNGNRTLISSGNNTSQGSGPLFDSPSGLTIDTSTETGWVVDRELAAIIEVNLTNGDRSILSIDNKMGATDYKLPIALEKYENKLYISDIYYMLYILVYMC